MKETPAIVWPMRIWWNGPTKSTALIEKWRIHFVVFGGVKEPQVQLSLVSHGLACCGDLLLHDVQRRVDRVVELQLILCRDTPDVQRVVLRRTHTARIGIPNQAQAGSSRMLVVSSRKCLDFAFNYAKIVDCCWSINKWKYFPASSILNIRATRIY